MSHRNTVRTSCVAALLAALMIPGGAAAFGLSGLFQPVRGLMRSMTKPRLTHRTRAAVQRAAARRIGEENDDLNAQAAYNQATWSTRSRVAGFFGMPLLSAMAFVAGVVSAPVALGVGAAFALGSKVLADRQLRSAVEYAARTDLEGVKEVSSERFKSLSWDTLAEEHRAERRLLAEQQRQHEQQLAAQQHEQSQQQSPRHDEQAVARHEQPQRQDEQPQRQEQRTEAPERNLSEELLARQWEEIGRLQHELGEQKQALKAMEEQLTEKQTLLAEREQTLSEQQQSGDADNDALQRQQEQIQQLRTEIADLRQTLQADSAAWQRRHEALNERKIQLNEQENGAGHGQERRLPDGNDADNAPVDHDTPEPAPAPG